METTLAVVELAPAPFRPYPKRTFGGLSLLDWVVRRASESLLIDHVAVLAPDTTGEIPLPSDVDLVTFHDEDLLGGYAATVSRFDFDAVVRVRMGDPFIDPVLIDRLVTNATATRYDYVTYCLHDGRPAIETQLGICTEWCRSSAIELASRKATNAVDRRNMTRFMYSHSNLFKTRLIPVPKQLDRPDVRLIVEQAEDWEHAEAILEALGPDELDWQRIARLLDQQPAMRQRMAQLNQTEEAVA